MRYVREQGKRIRTQRFDVRFSASPLQYARVGIVVPKFNRSAVERNRLKRRLRELARMLLLPELLPVDVVIWSRLEAYEVPYRVLLDDIKQIVKRVRTGLE